MSEISYCVYCGDCELVAFDWNYYGIGESKATKEIIKFVKSEHGVDMCKGHKFTKEHDWKYCNECGLLLSEHDEEESE